MLRVYSVTSPVGHRRSATVPAIHSRSGSCSIVLCRSGVTAALVLPGSQGQSFDFVARAPLGPAVPGEPIRRGYAEGAFDSWAGEAGNGRHTAGGRAGGGGAWEAVGQEGPQGRVRSPHFANTGFLGALEAIGRVLEQETRQNATGSPSRTQIRHLGRPPVRESTLRPRPTAPGAKRSHQGPARPRRAPFHPADGPPKPARRPDGRPASRPADQLAPIPTAGARQQGGPPQTSLPHLPLSHRRPRPSR